MRTNLSTIIYESKCEQESSSWINLGYGSFKALYHISAEPCTHHPQKQRETQALPEQVLLYDYMKSIGT